MIATQSKIFKGAVAALAAIPLAAAATFTPAGSAQAAALVGDFALAGNGNSTLRIDSLTFNNPTNFDIVDDGTLDSFSPFTTGRIGNIISFAGNNADNPFLDLGTDFGSTITDGLDTFELTAAEYMMEQDGLFVEFNVTIDGIFTSATGNLSKGKGFLTLQKIGNLETFESILDEGGEITGLTYSGVQFATVPEPATLLGLGVVAAGMAVSRRRKTVPQ